MCRKIKKIVGELGSPTRSSDSSNNHSIHTQIYYVRFLFFKHDTENGWIRWRYMLTEGPERTIICVKPSCQRFEIELKTVRPQFKNTKVKKFRQTEANLKWSVCNRFESDLTLNLKIRNYNGSLCVRVFMLGSANGVSS